MDKITVNAITRHDINETELEFTVRGHKVTGLFPATPKCGIYRSIRNILIDTYIRNNFGGNFQKIGQNTRNMR